jgi:hydrogenase/urease accessory protein HupE
VRRAILLLWLSVQVVPALAHEVRPAFLEMRETEANVYQVLWKTPMRGDLRLFLEPVFSVQHRILTPPATRYAGGASIQTWRLEFSDDLRGGTLGINGLSGTMTDALVRIEFTDGTSWLKRLTPAQYSAEIPMRQSWAGVAVEYLKLGVEHILLGIDHLLFVLVLLIITRGTRRLVKTVTAFTVAHSITLGLAALGMVHVPSAPVEAVIALSIVFVATEILRSESGRAGITARAPWIVAFAFGLLHGFGFAGALSEIGLPQDHIPVALLFFNIGVEVGQLLFIAAVLSLIALRDRIDLRLPGWSRRVPPYLVGSVASFWVIQRVAAF